MGLSKWVSSDPATHVPMPGKQSMAVAGDGKPGHEHTTFCSMRCNPNLCPDLSLGAALGCSPHSILGGDGDSAPAQLSKPPQSKARPPQQEPGRWRRTDKRTGRWTAEGASGRAECGSILRRSILLHPIRGDNPSRWLIPAQRSLRSGQGPAVVFAECSRTDCRQGVSDLWLPSSPCSHLKERSPQTGGGPRVRDVPSEKA